MSISQQEEHSRTWKGQIAHVAVEKDAGTITAREHNKKVKVVHLLHYQQGSAHLKGRVATMGQTAVPPATLSATDSWKLIGPHWLSGFRSPAHLLVNREAWGSAKWQTVPEIWLHKSPVWSLVPPGTPLSSPLVAPAGEWKHWHR